MDSQFTFRCGKSNTSPETFKHSASRRDSDNWLPTFFLRQVRKELPFSPSSPSLPPEHQQHARPNSHNTHRVFPKRKKEKMEFSTGNELLASPLQRRDWSFGAHTHAVGGGGGGRAALTLWNGRKKGGKGRLRTHRRRREEEVEEHFKSPFAAYALACVTRGKERGPPLTIIISRITQVFFFFLFRLRDVQMWIFLLSSPLFSSPRLC